MQAVCYRYPSLSILTLDGLDSCSYVRSAQAVERYENSPASRENPTIEPLNVILRRRHGTSASAAYCQNHASFLQQPFEKAIHSRRVERVNSFTCSRGPIEK